MQTGERIFVLALIALGLYWLYTEFARGVNNGGVADNPAPCADNPAADAVPNMATLPEFMAAPPLMAMLPISGT